MVCIAALHSLPTHPTSQIRGRVVVVVMAITKGGGRPPRRQILARRTRAVLVDR